LVITARLLFPRRAFFLATLPVALFGAIYMGADFLRGADLLALLLQWRTFSTVDACRRRASRGTGSARRRGRSHGPTPGTW
jgi:hypothetical protein